MALAPSALSPLKARAICVHSACRREASEKAELAHELSRSEVDAQTQSADLHVSLVYALEQRPQRILHFRRDRLGILVLRCGRTTHITFNQGGTATRAHAEHTVSRSLARTATRDPPGEG